MSNPGVIFGIRAGKGTPRFFVCARIGVVARIADVINHGDIFDFKKVFLSCHDLVCSNRSSIFWFYHLYQWVAHSS